MLSIVFEVPDSRMPLEIVARSWEQVRQAYPGEHGEVWREPSELGLGLVRITLQVPTREPLYTLLLEALTTIDIWCRRQLSFPSIYAGLVRYEEEPPGLELWASTPAVFARGFADCEDLVCDRVAELAIEGKRARPILQLEERTAHGDYWHVLVEHADGSIEDPSAALGMR